MQPSSSISRQRLWQHQAESVDNSLLPATCSLSGAAVDVTCCARITLSPLELGSRSYHYRSPSYLVFSTSNLDLHHPAPPSSTLF